MNDVTTKRQEHLETVASTFPCNLTARSRRLVNRQPHLPFDDDPPLGAVAMFRHGGILARLEQSRRRGPSLQQSQGDASQSRVGFGQLLDEVWEFHHEGRIRPGTLKVAAGKGRGRRRRYRSGWSSTRKTSSRSVRLDPPTRGDPLSQGSDGRESCSAGGYSAWSRQRTFMTPSPIRRHSQPQSNRAATIRVFRAGKRKSLALPRSNSTAVTVIVPPLSRLATSQRDVANHACPAGSTVS